MSGVVLWVARLGEGFAVVVDASDRTTGSFDGEDGFLRASMSADVDGLFKLLELSRAHIGHIRVEIERRESDVRKGGQGGQARSAMSTSKGREQKRKRERREKEKRATYTLGEDLEPVSLVEVTADVGLEDVLDGNDLCRVEPLEVDPVLNRLQRDGLVVLSLTVRTTPR
jgi:DNA-binding PadR family transcriptional regulator